VTRHLSKLGKERKGGRDRREEGGERRKRYLFISVEVDVDPLIHFFFLLFEGTHIVIEMRDLNTATRI